MIKEYRTVAAIEGPLMIVQEVADATGVPVNTVRSRMRLAKEALRRRIEADPDLLEMLEVAG